MMTTNLIFRTCCWPIAMIYLVSLASCKSDTEAIVQAKVAERVNDFIAKKKVECMESLLQTAEHKVDSLLLTDAQNALNDSLARLRPGRPVQPPRILPLDSFTIKPIFDGIAPASGTGK